MAPNPSVSLLHFGGFDKAETSTIKSLAFDRELSRLNISSAAHALAMWGRAVEAPESPTPNSLKRRSSETIENFRGSPFADVCAAVYVQHLTCHHLADFRQINDRVHDVFHIGELPRAVAAF
jgi:hypothetical protein